MPQSKTPRKPHKPHRQPEQQQVAVPRFQAFQPGGKGNLVKLQVWRYDEKGGALEPVKNPALMIADLIRLYARMFKVDPADLMQLIEEEIAEPTCDENGEHVIP